MFNYNKKVKKWDIDLEKVRTEMYAHWKKSSPEVRIMEDVFTILELWDKKLEKILGPYDAPSSTATDGIVFEDE